MVEVVLISYDLGESGWSSFALTVADRSIHVGPFGYLTDALGDLVRAALVIATFGDHAEATFNSEPCEWRLVIDRINRSDSRSTEMRIAVTTWAQSENSGNTLPMLDPNAVEDFASLGPDWKLAIGPAPLASMQPQPEHVTIFEAAATSDAFALSVVQCAQAVLDQHGIEGYDKLWGGRKGFPLRALASLKAAVSVQNT